MSLTLQGSGCFKNAVTVPSIIKTLRKNGWTLGPNLWESQDRGLRVGAEASLRPSSQDHSDRADGPRIRRLIFPMVQAVM